MSTVRKRGILIYKLLLSVILRSKNESQNGTKRFALHFGWNACIIEKTKGVLLWNENRNL